MVTKKGITIPENQIWSSIFNTINDVAIVINREFVIVQANKKCLELFQKGNESIVGQKCFHVVCSKDDPHEKCPLQCHLKKHEETQTQILNLNNKHFKVTTTPIKNENDDVELFVDIMHDITTEVENELALKEQLEENQTLNEEYISTIEELEERNQQLIDLKATTEENEKKYRKIFEDSTLGIFKTTFEGKFIEVNQAFAEIFGYKNPEEILSNINSIPDQLYVHPERRQIILESLEQTRTKKLKISNDFYKKDGSIIHTNLYYRISYDILLKKEVIEGFVEDVTQQHLAQEQKDKLERIINLSPAVAIKWLNKPGWPVEYVSDNVESILGYSVDEFYAQDFVFTDLIHPDDIASVTNKVREEEQKPETVHFYHHPYRIKTKNGSYIWVNDHTYINRIDNKIVSYEGIILDYNEQINAANKLTETQEKFRTIFNMATELICIADLNTATFIDVNPAFKQLLGYDEAELLSKPFLDFVHPDDMEQTVRIIDEELKKGKDKIQFKNRYRCKDGSYKHLDWNSHPIAEKGVTYAIAHDITSLIEIQESLKKSEEQMRVLIDQSVDMIFLHELDGQITSVNLKAVRQYGYTKRELTEMNIAALDVYSDAIIYQKEFLSQLDRNSPFIFESIHKRNDGTYFDVEIACTKIHIGDKDLIMTSCRDITERKQLQNEQQFHSLLINNLNDYVTATDLDGHITFVNEAACKMLERTKEELIGQHVSILGEDKNLGGTQQEIAEKTIQQSNWKGEIVNVSKSGKRIILKCHTRLITSEIGEPIGMIGISSDITARKQYEKELEEKSSILERQNEKYQALNEELEESLERIQTINEKLENREQRLELLLKASREVIKFDSFETTAQKLFSLCKEATGAVSGYVALLSANGDENEVLFLDSGGLTCTVDENLPMPIRGLREQAYLTQKPAFDNDFMHSDWIKYMPKGHVTLNNVLFAPLLINNSAVGLIGLANKPIDFTNEDAKIVESLAELCSIALYNTRTNENLKIAKQKAEESDRLKSAFLANMSHEIRTPLNGILGFTDILCSKADSTSQQKERYADIIRTSSEGLLRIINDILDISKLESGQLNIDKKTFNLRRTLDNLFEIYLSKQQKRNSSVLLKYAPTHDQLLINSDEDRIRQVMINLLDNAFKYTSKGNIEYGYNIIGTEKIELFVRDTGTGIAKAHHERIFERFQQAKTNENSIHRGNGLGLTISKNLVELMGGHMQLDSEPGIGSRFSFILPIGKTTDKIASKKDNQKAADEKVKILIVEDDLVSRVYLNEILSDINAETYFTESGNEALSLAKSNWYNLILMDIRLPDADGLEIVKKIRKFNTKVPIIAQTAFAMEKNKTAALLAGCNDYISKPIEQKKLFEKIQEIVSNEKNFT